MDDSLYQRTFFTCKMPDSSRNRPSSLGRVVGLIVVGRVRGV